jgi:hypothetical protein
MEERKSGLQSELTKLAKYITGELDLKKKEEELAKMKEAAVERQKDLHRKEIVKGEVLLVKDDVTEKKVVQKITLFDWEAPIRFKFPLDMKTYMTTVGLSMIFVVYLAVLGHYGLMASLIALLFFVYVAGTTEPITVKHLITSRGIDTMEKMYEWYMLDQFFFTKKDDEYMLHVDTKLRFPARLLLVVHKKDISPIFVLLQDKLLYRDIRNQSWLEKRNFGEYIKLEEI